MKDKEKRMMPGHPMKTIRRLFSYFRFNFGLFIMGIVLIMVSSVAQIATNAMLSPVIDSLVTDRSWNAFVHSLLVMSLFALTVVLGNWFGTRGMSILAQRTVFRLRDELIQKLHRLPISYFDTHTHGETMSSFTNDIDILTQSLEQSVSQILLSVILFVGTIIMMIKLSFTLTLVVAASLVVMVLTTRFIASKSGAYYRRRQAMTADLNGYVEEMIGAQKVVKVFDYEDRAIEAFDERAEGLRHAAHRAATFGVMLFPVMGNLSYVMYALVAMIGSFFVIGGTMSIGNIATFLQFTRSIGQPITQVSNQMNSLFAAIAGAERIFRILDLEEEETEGPVRLTKGAGKKNLAWKVPKEDGTFELVPVNGDIRFFNVYFGYNESKMVLKDISLYAKPGQKIALVGSTGAGKTTITNLINRFYEINDGVITFDGIDISKIDKLDLRSVLSVVLQEVNLFHGTIADNIRYGRLDATDEDVVHAAMSANAHSFISKLEKGYDTLLTDGGAGLSQGERQLLSIARAAIADPIVLIMDEATSSVDTRTESLIQEGMDKLMEGRTTFVIAHRLSTVRNSNAIMVLEQGEIVERGNHDELMALRGRYYDLNTGKLELD